MRLRSVWGCALGLTVAASMAACGGGGSSEPASTAAPAATAPGAQKVDPATAGDVTGLVVLEGAAPKNEALISRVNEIAGNELLSAYQTRDKQARSTKLKAVYAATQAKLEEEEMQGSSGGGMRFTIASSIGFGIAAKRGSSR